MPLNDPIQNALDEARQARDLIDASIPVMAQMARLQGRAAELETQRDHHYSMFRVWRRAAYIGIGLATGGIVAALLLLWGWLTCR
jgi:hypothetical protein